MRVALGDDDFKDLEYELRRAPDCPPVVRTMFSSFLGKITQGAAIDLLESVPSRATWDTHPDIPDDVLARDEVLLAGLLSVWKVLRLCEATVGAWNSGPAGFHPLVGTGSSRAAMEEGARLALASQVYLDKTDAWTSESLSTVREVSESLLSTGDSAGLDVPAPTKKNPAKMQSWKIFDGVKDANRLCRMGYWPGTQGDVDELYGYLSTLVHPKGVGRAIFRNRSFPRGEELRLEPSKASLTTARAAALLGLLYAIDLTQSGWNSCVATAAFLHDRAGLNEGDTTTSIWVPVENDIPLKSGIPVRAWRDAPWVYWAPAE